jgi:hypothetical protein
MKAIVATLAAYVSAFIITYGHAYNQIGLSAGENAVGAFISSVFWPLYWSVQMWK